MAVPLKTFLAASAAEPAVDDGDGDQVNILIVDDLPEKLMIFEAVLEDLKQNIVCVRSGTEALREVLAREFAVILLDVNMPDIDGLETAALIRRYKRSAHTPIIFVTAYADEIQTSRGYSLGAVDYILSPVVPEVLRSKVRVFVELAVLQRRIARQADERVALAASAAALQAAEESNRRSACLSDLSHALSGVLEPRIGMQELLARLVPQVSARAAVLLFDDERRPQHLLRRGAQDGVARLVNEDQLSTDERALVQQLTDDTGPPAGLLMADGADQGGEGTSLRVYALRDGDRLLGALLLHGPLTSLGQAVIDEFAQRAATAFAAARLHQNLQAEIAERRQAEARLEEQGRRKDEFLAMLSHELRNPLAPIRNAVEVIRRLAPHDAKLMWATDITDRQVRQLTRLVDELLDVARISQGKIVLRPEALDLGALLAECVEVQRPAIAARRQMLNQSLPAAPLWVQGDAARLQQVVSNLLSNAVKYTPDGGQLFVGAWVEAGQAVVSVRDNGIGIEPELLPRVFDLFEQGQRSLDRSQGGLGVGLTLVQRLVRLHGGRVEARSAGPGQGSEFRVWLPWAAQAAPEAAPAAGSIASEGSGRRILVVDDNADVAETTATMLELSGHRVLTAPDGQQALDCVEDFEPEIVLLDIGLPGLDGYEVARRLRQLPKARRAWLVAVTGYGQPADRQRGREAGFDEHQLKPVDPQALAEMIERVGPMVAARFAESAGAGTGSSTGGEGGVQGATLYAFRRP
jgi:signal transduction histidine kinase/DNA-binding response OmpR family regulator